MAETGQEVLFGHQNPTVALVGSGQLGWCVFLDFCKPTNPTHAPSFIEIIMIAKLPESYADFHFDGDSFNGPLLDERPADGFGLSPKLPGLGAGVGRPVGQSRRPSGRDGTST
jgi:hypothetical protein